MAIANMCQTVSTVYAKMPTKPGTAAVITWQELALHNTPDSLWVAVEGTAYDVTAWSKVHPGGWKLLQSYGGLDATEPFLAYHAGPSMPRARAQLARFAVGRLEERPVSEQALKFRELSAAAESAGLYSKRKEAHYWLLYAYLAALYASTWLLVAHQQLLAASLTIGMFWGQLAFVGHDVCHGAVHGSKRLMRVAALAVNALLGIGCSHWTESHNAHHAFVNSTDHDPEVEFMPFIATSTLQFEHTKAQEPGRTAGQLAYGWISRHLISVQHYTFLPLLFVARYKFYIQSLGHLVTGKKAYVSRWGELAAQLLFFAWFAALTSLLPTWRLRLAWVLLSHASDWLLYLQTVITHFPRDVIAGKAVDWIGGQAAGSLNWSCPPWLDWFHGGLHFQIEHHLFPRMPRHNLRAASSLVRPALAALGVQYHCPTFWGAIVETYYSLRKVAHAARANAPAALSSLTVEQLRIHLVDKAK